MKRTALITSLLCLLITTAGSANLARIAGLGLLTGDSDWIINDPENIISNPALLPLHTGRIGLIELNAIDNEAENVYGTALFSIGKRLHMGLTIGYPMQNATDLNLYRTGDPANSAYIVKQTYGEGGLLTWPSIIPTVLSPFSSAAVSPGNLDETVDKQSIAVHTAVDLDNILTGFTVSYGGAGAESEDLFSNVTNISNSTRTAESAWLRQFEFKAGLHIKQLMQNLTVSIDSSFQLPVLDRSSRTYHPYDPAYYNERNISFYHAYGVSGGTTVKYSLNKFTSFALRFQYKYQDYSISVKERVDNNGDGDYMSDASDRNITDWHIRRYNTWLTGLSANHYIFFQNGISLNVFVGSYFKLVKHDIRSQGSRADNNTSVTGDNYTDPYELNVTEIRMPVIIGGEAKLADWLIARFSAVRNVIDSWKERTVLRNFTAGIDNVISYSEYTRSFKEAPLTILNVGMTLKLAGFTMDWLVKKSWFGKGGSLVGEEEAISTQFSISFAI